MRRETTRLVQVRDRQASQLAGTYARYGFTGRAFLPAPRARPAERQRERRPHTNPHSHTPHRLPTRATSRASIRAPPPSPLHTYGGLTHLVINTDRQESFACSRAPPSPQPLRPSRPSASASRLAAGFSASSQRRRASSEAQARKPVKDFANQMSENSIGAVVE